MGSKLARALGCHVTVLSRNPSKENFAKGECNANAFVCTGPVYKKDMEKVHGTIDLILNTIPVTHDYAFYLPFLAPKGQQVILGLHDGIVAGFILGKLSGGKSRIKHSGIGGIRATQEVLDLCAKHDIKPEIEIRPPLEPLSGLTQDFKYARPSISTKALHRGSRSHNVSA